MQGTMLGNGACKANLGPVQYARVASLDNVCAMEALLRKLNAKHQQPLPTRVLHCGEIPSGISGTRKSGLNVFPGVNVTIMRPFLKSRMRKLEKPPPASNFARK